MKNYFSFTAVVLLALLSLACSKSSGEPKTIATQQLSNGLTLTVATDKGHFSAGANEFTLEFKNASGEPADVGTVTADIYMPAMGSMPVMRAAATDIQPVAPGTYRGKIDIEINGTWQLTVNYNGPAGAGKTVFNINAR